MQQATRTLEQAGIPFDVIPLPDTGSSAASLGYPEAYVARAVVCRAGNELVAAFLPADARLDEARLAQALDAPAVSALSPAEAEEALGVPPEALSPFGLEGARALWERRLLRAPVLLVPSGEPGSALKIDRRHLRKASLESAEIGVAPQPPPGSAYDVLLERGFIDRVTSERLAREKLSDPEAAAYIGFDPTADSLHVGSLVPIMALANVQRAGGRVIAVVGGGTALIGDPSGRTDLRQMLTPEGIERNMRGLRRQLSAYLSIDDRRHLMLNNADWLADKRYIEFLREVGTHFSVNRMIAAECFRSRLEKGLSFIEFNYMLLQAYDFTVLAREHNCKAQMGGSDQWGNICAGIDLGRRMNGEELAGVTFPLIESASGRKFGKTEAGNVWLDAARTSPHEFFQFWRNADDADVERFLGLFTFIPMDEARAMCAVPAGPEMNEAKKALAFAATRLLHGEDAAIECLRTAEALFGGVSRALRGRLERLGLVGEDSASALEKPAEATGLPTVELGKADLPQRGLLAGVLADLGLAKTRSEGRRLIQQGGVYLNDAKVADEKRALAPEDFADGEAMLRVGKKRHGVVKLG